MPKRTHLKKPPWLKVKIPSGSEFREVIELLRTHRLATVCQEARCPNINECWSKKSATIMILGSTCTRACRFCAVRKGNPRGRIDEEEPEHVAQAVSKLGLRYVVITSVDRDDLEDGGSRHYARTIMAIRESNPEVKVEVLIPDFQGRRDLLQQVADAGPYVIGHNVETVERLTAAIRDRRCGYLRSLQVLENVKSLNGRIRTKSGFMLGLGETREEVIQTMRDLQHRRVDIVTIGQYLQPTIKNHNVQRYYTPAEFLEFEGIGEELGIPRVVAGPLVRSSYHAADILTEEM